MGQNIKIEANDPNENQLTNLLNRSIINVVHQTNPIKINQNNSDANQMIPSLKRSRNSASEITSNNSQLEILSKAINHVEASKIGNLTNQNRISGNSVSSNTTSICDNV